MESTNFVDNFQFIVEEIPGSEGGVGTDISLSNVYDSLKNARMEEDDELSLGIWERDLKKADWKEVLTTSTEVLTNQSKDLQVVAWLLEAIVSLDGISAIPKCLDILKNFLESFWYTCFPQDEEQKARVLEWIVEKLNDKLIVAKFIDGVSIYDHEYSVTMKNLIKRTPNEEAQILQSAAKGNKKTLEELQHMIKNATDEQLDSVRNYATSIREAISSLLITIKKISSGSDIVSFAVFSSNLDKIEKLITRPEKVKAPAEEGELPSEAPMSEEETENHYARRENIYIKLKEAMDELIILEKHSPIPFILSLVISWKNKNLYEIMEDIQSGTSEAHKLLKILFNK